MEFFNHENQNRKNSENILTKIDKKFAGEFHEVDKKYFAIKCQFEDSRNFMNDCRLLVKSKSKKFQEKIKIAGN